MQLHWHLADLARNLAGAGLGRIADLPELKSGITLNVILAICM